MRIAGLVASPRKHRNTDTLVQRILDGCADAGAATAKIYLNDLAIRPCQACKVQDGNGCLFHDGMDEVYELIQTVDGLVLGTPVYYNSVSSQMKLMLDRCQCLARPVRLPSGRVAYESAVRKPKLGILVSVGGSGLNPDCVLPTFDIWSPEVNLRIVDRILATQAQLGMEPMDNGALLERAFAMGREFPLKLGQGAAGSPEASGLPRSKP